MTCSPFAPNGIDRSPVSQAANSSFALTSPSLRTPNNDGAEFVQDIVRTVRLCGNFRVQSNQRLTEMILNEDFMRLA